ADQVALSVAVHPDDAPSLAHSWAAAVAAGDIFEHEFRLLRHDGTWRWFLGRARPQRDPSGTIVRWFGTNTDIEDRRRGEEQLKFLTEAGELLAAPASVGELMQQFAERATGVMADLVTIFAVDRDGALDALAIAHRDPKGLHAWREVRRLYPLRRGDLAMQVFASGKPVLLERVPPDLIARISRDDRHRAILEGFNVASAAFVPLIARTGEAVGVLQIANGVDSRRLAESDLRFAEILARRLAISIETAEVFERERRISETFQDAALPRTLPSLPGIALTAVYRAAQKDAEIGGDWYDAVVLPDGRLMLSIGDVAGKGLRAAVLMASVRNSIRTAAVQVPIASEILATVALALAIEPTDSFVTAWVGVLDPQTRHLTYAFAGHPSPLVREPDGTVHALPGAAQPPLGVTDDVERHSHEITLPVGATLVLFTDGLIESARDVTEGERRLVDAVQRDAFRRSANPARFVVDSVLFDGAHDDVAVMTVALGRRSHWVFHSHDAMRAEGARFQFVERLRELATPESDLASAELIFGELIGNVVRHGPGSIDVDLEWEGERAVLHVMDRGPHFTPNAELPEDPWSEDGRGLFLIAALGENLSYAPLPVRGNHLSVVLPVRRRTNEERG
ncbi:MAG: peptidylprolyl isomerase, partial [Candidatus Eremiobacteraeota bacterium]|nr:peptidylprolyl isomerase [Candidatus Eremiobacteraeota bacterium]